MPGTAPTLLKEMLDRFQAIKLEYQKLEDKLSKGPSSYYFGKLQDYIDGLFSLSKFKIGDKVALVDDVDISNAPGWRGSEHFLKKGATAVVEDVDFGKKGFHYCVVFDNETFLHPITGIATKVSIKHSYWFLESDLYKVE